MGPHLPPFNFYSCKCPTVFTNNGQSMHLYCLFLTAVPLAAGPCWGLRWLWPLCLPLPQKVRGARVGQALPSPWTILHGGAFLGKAELVGFLNILYTIYSLPDIITKQFVKGVFSLQRSLYFAGTSVLRNSLLRMTRCQLAAARHDSPAWTWGDCWLCGHSESVRLLVHLTENTIHCLFQACSALNHCTVCSLHLRVHRLNRRTEWISLPRYKSLPPSLHRSQAVGCPCTGLSPCCPWDFVSCQIKWKPSQGRSAVLEACRRWTSAPFRAWSVWQRLPPRPGLPVASQQRESQSCQPPHLDFRLGQNHHMAHHMAWLGWLHHRPPHPNLAQRLSSPTCSRADPSGNQNCSPAMSLDGFSNGSCEIVHVKWLTMHRAQCCLASTSGPHLECGWRHTGNVQGGGACKCPRLRLLFNFSEGRWRHTDNVQGGCLWMSSSPFRKSCIRACI